MILSVCEQHLGKEAVLNYHRICAIQKLLTAQKPDHLKEAITHIHEELTLMGDSKSPLNSLMEKIGQRLDLLPEEEVKAMMKNIGAELADNEPDIIEGSCVTCKHFAEFDNMPTCLFHHCFTRQTDCCEHYALLHQAEEED